MQVLEEVELTDYQIPITYNLENKLLLICIQDFMTANILHLKSEERVATKIKLELGNLLVKHFKYAFTKIDIEVYNTRVKGVIEYTGGLPLKFELETK